MEDRENTGKVKSLLGDMKTASEVCTTTFKTEEVNRLQDQLCELLSEKENQHDIISWVKGAESKIQADRLEVALFSD